MAKVLLTKPSQPLEMAEVLLHNSSKPEEMVEACSLYQATTGDGPNPVPLHPEAVGLNSP